MYFHGASGELLFAFCKHCVYVINVNCVACLVFLTCVVCLKICCYLCGNFYSCRCILL